MAEKTTTAQVTDKGRVTIPHEIREILGIEKDDYVELVIRVED